MRTETVTRDIHCVTKWSKLDTVWRGVSVDTLLEGVETSAEYVLVSSYGGYTTNLPLTAPDGYQAQRSYCIASAPDDRERVAITVERIEDGEVSPYLVDQLELRGPIAGYFVWNVDMAVRCCWPPAAPECARSTHA